MAVDPVVTLRDVFDGPDEGEGARHVAADNADVVGNDVDVDGRKEDA